MRIAVIAANGRSGQAFVEVALAAGHTVRGGVRNSSHLIPHANLEVVSCDATKTHDIRKLCSGQEAVVSLIGHVRHSAPDVQTIATQRTIEVMHQLGIMRYVS